MMIVRVFLSVFLMLHCFAAFAQNAIDSIAIYQERGVSLFDKGQHKEAQLEFLQALRLAENSHSSRYLEILNNLGNIAGYMGESERAIEYYQKALRSLSLAEKPKEFEAKILKNIGATYSDLEDFKTAITYFEKSESIARSLNNEELVADCLNNKGIIYEQTGNMPLALEVYAQAMEIYRKTNNKERLALVWINMGVAAKALSKLDEAKRAYDSALFYSREIENDYYISATLNNLGNVLAKLGNYEDAIKLTFEALAISRKIGQLDVEQNCLASLAEHFHSIEKNAEAFKYQQEYSSLHDSIINIERVNALTEMETKYDVEKKELRLAKLSAENELKQKENERNRLYLIMLFALLFMVLIGSIIRARFITLRQRKTELELVAITEKHERERIAKDMHDELGAGISRITWITANAERTVKDEALKMQIGSIEVIATQLSSGMKSLIWLLNHGECEWSVLSSRIREMAGQIADDFEVNLTFESIGIPGNAMIRQKASRDLLLICKEALNNTAKYAAAKNVAIVFQLIEEDLHLTISDDGIGFDTSEVSRGHGLNNIERRVLDLMGSYALKSEKNEGTMWQMKFPKGQMLI